MRSSRTTSGQQRGAVAGNCKNKGAVAGNCKQTERLPRCESAVLPRRRRLSGNCPCTRDAIGSVFRRPSAAFRAGRSACVTAAARAGLPDLFGGDRSTCGVAAGSRREALARPADARVLERSRWSVGAAAPLGIDSRQPLRRRKQQRRLGPAALSNGASHERPHGAPERRRRHLEARRVMRNAVRSAASPRSRRGQLRPRRIDSFSIPVA